MSTIFEAVRDVSCIQAARMLGIQYKMRGSFGWAFCPLHGETGHPSMMLTHDDGWYCFGCHAGGDAVRLYESYLGLDAIDAARQLAKDMGFVSWELQHARLVGNVLYWISGNGTYRIELTQREFRAYYAKTNTLSVYREFRKRIDEPPPKMVKQVAAKVNPIAHSKQAEARDMASNMFSTMFKKG